MINTRTLTSFVFSSIFFLLSCNKKEDSNNTVTPAPALAPTAAFNYAGAGVPAPATVTFTNNSTNANTYAWDFGDNSTSTLKDPQHTYTAGGVYTVQLTSTGTGGSASITKTINISSTPTTCKITSIKITAMPFTDLNGSGWDPFDGPDVFFKIVTQNNSVLLDGTSSRFNNITTNSLPLTWNLSTPFSITPLNTNRYIDIYDYDTLDPDDLIGTIGFNPQLSFAGYPATKTLSNQGLTIVLGLQWQ